MRKNLRVQRDMIATETEVVGHKDDGGKMRWSLLPWSALQMVVEVINYGAQRYGDYNWTHVDEQRYTEALLRHVAAEQMGEVLDPETGLPHLAHVATNALFLLFLRHSKKS